MKVQIHVYLSVYIYSHYQPQQTEIQISESYISVTFDQSPSKPTLQLSNFILETLRQTSKITKKSEESKNYKIEIVQMF